MEGKTRDWIEQAVVESDRRRCAAKVSSIEAEDAVAQGDNYCSDLKRLRLEVVLNSGERQTRWLIFKALPPGETRVFFAKKCGLFRREARVFLDVLPEMEDIWREKENVTEFLWPQFYSAQRRYEGLLMEDLSAKGFKMADRRKGLDYEHCSLVMKSLSKFHALGAILRRKRDLRIQDFYPSVFAAEYQNFSNFYQHSLAQCATVMETKWKGEWIQLAERCRKLSEKIEKQIYEEYKKDDSKFLTLNHGDCWLNNMLFRYDESGKLEAMRFIDFQLAHYNVPGFDIQYFLQSSPNLETRSRKMDLIRDYQASLAANLRRFGYPEDDIPSLEAVMEYYEGAKYCGFGGAMFIVPILLAPREWAKTNEELEDMSKKFADKDNISSELNEKDDEYLTNSLKHIIKEAVENEIL